jgi:hypothetical protein
MTGPINGSPEEPAPTSPDDPPSAEPAEPDQAPPPAEPVEVTEPAGLGGTVDPAASATVDPPASTDPAAIPDSTVTPPPAGDLPSGWVAPAGSSGIGRSRGCCLILAVVGILGSLVLVVGVVFLIFLGGQVQSILGGSVQFEEGGSAADCSIDSPATTFSSSSTIHFVAFFERDVQPGEIVTTVVTFPDGTSQSEDVPMDEVGSCVTNTIPAGIDAGHWVIEFRSGSEVLATGGFDITE